MNNKEEEMSQHPSLRSKSKDAAHRSVLKRYERLKSLKEKEKWDEEKSVFGLPKVKVMKFKVKKEKPVEAEAAETQAVRAEGQDAAAKDAGKPEKKDAQQDKAKGKG